MRRYPILWAFLISPLVPVAWFVGVASVASIVLGLSDPASRHAVVGGTAIGALIYGLVALAVSYGVTVVLGIPAYFLAKHTVGIRRASVVGISAACGLVGALCVVALAFPATAILELWYVYILGGIFGGLAGHTFWKMTVSPSALSLQAGRTQVPPGEAT